MEDNPKTSGPQSSDTASTLAESRYVVINRLPPERLEWLRQQSLHVAEVCRRAAEAEDEAKRQSSANVAGARDPDTGEGADNGKV